MKKGTILTLLLIFLLVTNIATIGTFFWRGHHFKHRTNHESDGGFDNGFHGKEHHIGEMLKRKLDLDDQQQKEFAAMQNELDSSKAKLSRKISGQKQMFFKELENDAPNLTRIDSLSVEIGNSSAQFSKMMAEHIMKIRSICNAEQRHKLLEFLRNHEEHERAEKVK